MIIAGIRDEIDAFFVPTQRVEGGLLTEVFERNEREQRPLPKSTYWINFARCEGIQTCGPAIVDPILDTLEKRHAQDQLNENSEGKPLYFLIKAALPFVSLVHAQRIGSMLLWNEVLDNTDRSNRSDFLDALVRIGGATVIPILEEFTERVRSIEYPDYRGDPKSLSGFIPGSQYNVMDQRDIRIVIEEIRETNPPRNTSLLSLVAAEEHSLLDAIDRQRSLDQPETQSPEATSGRWIVVGKGEKSGIIFKHYLILRNTRTDEMVYADVFHDEYISLSVGDVVTHPTLERMA